MNEFQRKLQDLCGANSYIAKYADPARQILAIEPYSYVLDVNGGFTVGNANSNFFIIMDNDSEFVWVSIAGAARTQGINIPDFNANALIQITDQSKGITLFSAPVPMAFIGGVAGFPFYLTSPKIIKPRSTIKISAGQDFPAVVPSNQFDGGYMALHGAKIYYA